MRSDDDDDELNPPLLDSFHSHESIMFLVSSSGFRSLGVELAVPFLLLTVDAMGLITLPSVQQSLRWSVSET